ncbi:MAG: alkaline phosphatase family protein, partial [Curvibacter sp.]
PTQPVTPVASPAGPVSPSWTGRPRLLVLVVVDGLPQRQVLAYREQLAPDGFNRFLQQGAWYADAHYGHAYTVTAAGHAAVLTGAYPHRSGIIANEWRDAMSGQPMYCTGDLGAVYIGHKTQPLDGTSPRNLKVETVGDVLRGIDPRAKVIGISGKDRGAILPAGHKGTAYMYMTQTGFFARCTYSMYAPPAWSRPSTRASPPTAGSSSTGRPCCPRRPTPGRCPTASPGTARRPPSCP